MKSFGLCHEIISPVILKSFGLSQDLPLSQNGQNRWRGELGDGANGDNGANGSNGDNGANGSNGDNGANKADGGNEADGASGYSGKWAWLRGLIRPS